MAEGGTVGGDSRWGRDEVGLSRGFLAVGEVDFDVDVGGFAELGFGDPCKEEVGRGRGGLGIGRGGAIAGPDVFLLEEGDVAGDIVFGRGGGVDVDLEW